MVRSKKVGPYGTMQIKLIQQKLLSERAKNKIYQLFLGSMERIMIQSGTQDTFVGSEFSRLASLRHTKPPPVRKKRPSRRPPTAKQLAALKQGRKVLELRRGLSHESQK